MSHNLPQTSSSENYQAIFDNALETYKRKTGNDPVSDPLFRRIESCDSPDTVVDVLREQIPGFDQSANRLTTWVKPTINVLYTFSSTVGGAVSLVSIIKTHHSRFYHNICILGLPTSGSHIHRHWQSSISGYSPRQRICGYLTRIFLGGSRRKR